MAGTSPMDFLLNDPEQLRELTLQTFAFVDADNSGRIERSELLKALTNIANEAGLEPPTEEKVDKTLAELDKDNSGSLDPEEFQVLVVSLLQTLIQS